MKLRTVFRLLAVVLLVLIAPTRLARAQVTSGCEKMLADDLERAKSELSSCLAQGGGSQPGQNFAACYGIYGTKVGLAYAGYSICKSSSH